MKEFQLKEKRVMEPRSANPGSDACHLELEKSISQLATRALSQHSSSLQRCE